MEDSDPGAIIYRSLVYSMTDLNEGVKQSEPTSFCNSTVSSKKCSACLRWDACKDMQKSQSSTYNNNGQKFI